jgi:ankyrin repeat protein
MVAGGAGTSYLVMKGADLELRDRLGRTPLHVASERTSKTVYDIQTIKRLVSLGTDVNAVGNSVRSCLGRSLDDIATAKFIIQEAARITYVDLLGSDREIELRRS